MRKTVFVVVAAVVPMVAVNAKGQTRVDGPEPGVWAGHIAQIKTAAAKELQIDKKDLLVSLNKNLEMCRAQPYHVCDRAWWAVALREDFTTREKHDLIVEQIVNVCNLLSRKDGALDLHLSKNLKYMKGMLPKALKAVGPSVVPLLLETVKKTPAGAETRQELIIALALLGDATHKEELLDQTVTASDPSIRLSSVLSIYEGDLKGEIPTERIRPFVKKWAIDPYRVPNDVSHDPLGRPESRSNWSYPIRQNAVTVLRYYGFKYRWSDGNFEILE